MFICIYTYIKLRKKDFLISKKRSFNLEIKSLNMVNIFGFDKYIWIVNSGEIIEL